MSSCSPAHTHTYRVALVDHTGKVLYHSYVFQHPKNVLDYKTDSEREARRRR